MAVERLTDYTRRIWTALGPDAPVGHDIHVNDVIYYMDSSECCIVTNVYPDGSIDCETLPDIGGGGGGGDAVSVALAVDNFTMPAGNFVWQNRIRNVLNTGGCIHVIFDEQLNDSDTDRGIISVGYGGLSAWSVGTANPSLYWQVIKHQSSLHGYMRGVSNVTFTPPAHNGRVDIKMYLDYYFDVIANTTQPYTTAQQTFMTALASHPLISVGCNKSDAFEGAVIARFALEDE